MRVVDAVAAILQEEGIEFLSCYPSTPLIDAVAKLGIRPIVCRQERVGVGIADGYSRTVGSGRVGVFAMQFGPGAENAYPGIATAYSDGIPVLLLPMGHALGRRQVSPLFRSTVSYASITKTSEVILRPRDVVDVARRAFSALRNGVPGPVMIEIPTDVGNMEVPEGSSEYVPPISTRTMPNPADVDRVVAALAAAQSPVVYAGQGVLRAGATSQLVALAETLGIPVATSLGGKSAFPETHPLSLGVASLVATDLARDFLRQADVILAIGASLTRHFFTPKLPKGAIIIHSTLDADDLNKSVRADHALLGDAALVLERLVEAANDRATVSLKHRRQKIESQIETGRKSWWNQWMPILTSAETPITPYRVIHEFMQVFDPMETVVTHDSGSPRDQLVPLYCAGGPGTYIGWGKSHALGTGLGLIMGAKLATPEKACACFMGDAAIGMTGLDLETAARCRIPVLVVVLNNGTMAIERETLVESHEKYGTRDVGGNYALLAQAMSVDSRRVDSASTLRPALEWAKRTLLNGAPALVEVLTSPESRFANRSAM